MSQKISAAITGVAGYVPDYVLTNQELEKIIDTNDEWITSRTGIKERRILKGEGLGTSFMGAKAVEDLLKKTNTKPEEVDMVICATVTPDYFFPSASNLICKAVGIRETASFDLAAACSGFLNALGAGTAFIESGRYKKIVVVGADKMSSIVDYTDRTTCILFGDGADAAKKFRKLYAFYDEVMSKTGWNQYSTVHVGFRGQVVGTRKDAMEIRSDTTLARQLVKQMIKSQREEALKDTMHTKTVTTTRIKEQL
jgi:3-oxoacyl-[acyl-carrier-protein] synthase-3